MKYIMSILCAIFATAAPLGLLKAEEVSHESEVYAAFEASCLAFLDDFQSLPKILDGMGEQVDEKLAQKITVPQTGKVWRLRSDKNRIFIGITDSETCQIFSDKASGTGVLSLFKKFTHFRELGSEKIGSQTHLTFSVRHPHAFGFGDGYGIVMLTYSQILSGVMIAAIPESVVEKSLGRSLPRPY